MYKIDDIKISLLDFLKQQTVLRLNSTRLKNKSKLASSATSVASNSTGAVA